MQVREPSIFFCITKYIIFGSRSNHLGVSSIGIAAPCGLLNGTMWHCHSVSFKIPQFFIGFQLSSAIVMAQYCFFMVVTSVSMYTKYNLTGEFIIQNQKDWKGPKIEMNKLRRPDSALCHIP